MNIQVVNSLTFSDLHTTDQVLVRASVQCYCGKPNAGLLVGVRLPEEAHPHLMRYVMIQYHYGRKSWNLMIEHSIQKANEFYPDTLPNVVRHFEQLTGVTLPLIKVIDVGIGIYSAQSRYESDNPFRLEDGKFYTVADRLRGRRAFVADVRHGVTRICFVESDGGLSETFEPAVVLSESDWLSLKPLPEDKAA